MDVDFPAEVTSSTLNHHLLVFDLFGEQGGIAMSDEPHSSSALAPAQTTDEHEREDMVVDEEGQRDEPNRDQTLVEALDHIQTPPVSIDGNESDIEGDLEIVRVRAALLHPLAAHPVTGAPNMVHATAYLDAQEAFDVYKLLDRVNLPDPVYLVQWCDGDLGFVATREWRDSVLILGMDEVVAYIDSWKTTSPNSRYVNTRRDFLQWSHLRRTGHSFLTR